MTHHAVINIGYKVDHDNYMVACHTGLLCYWSGAIRRAVYRQRRPVTNIWINFREATGRDVYIWPQVIQWCYTGKLLDMTTCSDAIIGSYDDIEMLWNAVISLEMYELANYIMRLVFVKYTWGLSARTDATVKCNPRDCPFEASGAFHVFEYNRRGYGSTRLFLFIEDLIKARAPLARETRRQASQATIDSWLSFTRRDEGFREWIEGLGGLDHDNDAAVLPTHFNQWRYYMVPTLSRLSPTLQHWAVRHNENIGREGEELALAADWDRRGECVHAAYQWVFEEVLD
ncbi:hypothetical protein F4677DRAFT_462796 [Hypoxylon crocopeplum]|nr:hypothetical protein F4677DRAFT_462796 [Hypoxylon crocopeplum]